jgi:hypothetical protein
VAVSPSERGEVVLYLGLGQSLLALVPRLRPLGASPGPLDPARALVFAATGDPQLTRDPTLDLPLGALDTTYPHTRFGRSGPLTAASEAILAGLGPADTLLTVNLARKNTAIEAFLPGGAAFRNVEACLARAAELAAAQGQRFGRLIVSWVQGQADARTPQKLYLDRLAAFVDALDAALGAQTGGAGRLVFCLSQTTPFYDIGRRGAALAQADFADAHADVHADTHAGQVVMAGPEYMLERSDGVHLKPRGAVRLGAMHGHAIRAALAGTGWAPLRMVEAVVTGAEVRVTFAGGVGDLEVAADPAPIEAGVEVGVRSLDNLGFVWMSRNSAVRIVSARISGRREVALTLSEPPGTLARALLVLGFPAGIAAPEGFTGGDPATASGGATALRAGTGRVDPFGQPMHDWALLGRIVPRLPERG